MRNSKIKKKLKERISAKKGTYIIVTKGENCLDVNISTIEYLSNELNLSGVYITLNRHYKEILKCLEENKINTKKLFFIDGTSEDEHKTNNCIFLRSKNSLTELSLAITETCKNDAVKFIFFDSLTTLLLYNGAETVERFIYFLISKIKEIGTIFQIMISIDEEKSNKLLPRLSQICEKVVKIE